jgi:tight adherence protein B
VVTVLSVVVAPMGAGAVVALVRFARRATVRDRVGALTPRSSRLPTRVDQALARALVAADVHCEPVVALQWWVLAIVVAAVLGTVLSPAFGVLLAGAMAVSGPAGLHIARGRGRRRAAVAVPEVVERCALELRGGGTIATAIEALAQHDGALAVDFARVHERCTLGASIDDALARWADERDAPGVRATAGALALGASVGGACADALDGLAASLRGRLAVMAEARALSAQARLSAIVISCAPVGYLAWSAIIDPGPLQSLVGSFAGRTCLAVAATLEVLGMLWMRRVLREDDTWS